MSSVIKGSSNISLDFTTAGRITGDFSNATVANRVAFQTSTVNGGTAVSVVPNGTGTFSQFSAYTSADPTNSSVANVSAVSGSDIRVVSGITGTGTYLPLTFYTGGSERVRLDTSGNVGIGTSSPTQPLSIRNAGAAYLDLAGGSRTLGTNSFTFGQAGDGVVAFFQRENAAMYWAINSSEQMRLTSTGLGIGTSSPDAGLTVIKSATISSQANVAARIGANVTSDLLLGSLNGNAPFVASQGAYPLLFFTNATERARIDSSGNLLVGTTSVISGVTAKLALYSTDLANTANTCAMKNGANSTGGAFIRFANYLDATIGSITQPTSTTVAYNTSSDYRLKNITGPITTSGAYIDSLNPVEGTWKADGSAFVGLIAHEVQEASRTPVATGTKDGEQMQGMDYSSAEIIANMLAELKSLRARVAQLEAK